MMGLDPNLFLVKLESLILKKGLSFLLQRVGWEGGFFAAAILFAARALLATEEEPTGFITPFLGHMVLPENPDAGASTSFTKPEWEKALELPDNQAAPEPLRSHARLQLVHLFNIGKKHAVSEKTIQKYIEPLALENDEASVGFLKALLDRVNSLQMEHYNRGNHIPFAFQTKSEKERLYSIVWEYAERNR